jgi:hypothetical protein
MDIIDENSIFIQKHDKDWIFLRTTGEING